MAVLAHAFVRPLVEAQCDVLSEAAKRLIGAAERDADDAEAIHDFRVALRRLRTLLRAAAPLYKRGALRVVRDGLKEFGQAAGAVRDEEVLVETLSELDLPAAVAERVGDWLRRRARKQRALRRQVVSALSKVSFGADVSTKRGVAIKKEASAQAARPPGEERVPDTAQSGRGERGEAHAAQFSLRTDQRGIFEMIALARALPLRKRADAIGARNLAMDALEAAAKSACVDTERAHTLSPVELHQLRIRYKEVRYAGEILSEAITTSGALLDALARRVKEAARMQKRLGELHDVEEAMRRVRRARGLSAADRMVLRHVLTTARVARFGRVLEALPEAVSSVGGTLSAHDRHVWRPPHGQG